VLNAGERRSYAFVLRVPESLASAAQEGALPSLPTLEAVRKTLGFFSLQVLRSGVKLQEQQVKADDVPSGPLRLLAQREGTGWSSG